MKHEDVGKFAPAFVPELKEANLNENDMKELFDAIKMALQVRL